MHPEREKIPITRLVASLALVTAAAILMCVGIRWLFFVGLAVLAISGYLSSCSRIGVGRMRGFLNLLLWLVASAGFLWLSSFGREPLPLAAACAAVIANCISEVAYWGASRKVTSNA